MFFASLFTTSKIWNQCKFLSTEEWVKKMWCRYTVEFYSAIKSDVICQKIDGAGDHRMKSHTSNSEKHHAFSLSLHRNVTHTYICVYICIHMAWKKQKGVISGERDWSEQSRRQSNGYGREKFISHTSLLSRLCLPVCSSTCLMSEWRALSRRRKETSGKCRVAREGNRDKEKWSTMTRAYENVIKKHNSLDVD